MSAKRIQSTEVVDLTLRITANVQCESSGKYIDLSEGNNPVILFDQNPKTNTNEIWRIYTLPGNKSNRVVIQCKTNDSYLRTNGQGKPVTGERTDRITEAHQWFLEGADASNINPSVPIRFRNVEDNFYLDLEGNNLNIRTPFIAWPSNNGANQRFRVLSL